VIFTVFCTTAHPQAPWQAELLEYSWGHVRQPGELVRLVASNPEDRLPDDRLARVVRTTSWSPHPYTGDAYTPYDLAASLLEWLFTERIDGSILLLAQNNIFRAPVTREATRGTVQAMAWDGLPRGDGAFGLGSAFGFLDLCCVDRTLALPKVALPLLIHSSDLRRIAPRWLELMSIIRPETNTGPQGPRADADAIAYAIAAAEAGLVHELTEFAVGTNAPTSTAPILDYRRPIASASGKPMWGAETYDGGEVIAAKRAAPGIGREFLTTLAEFAARRKQGADLAFLRPCRNQRVREARILGRLFLEIPGRSDTVSVNASGAAIWECCDGVRSLAEINGHLEARFAMAPGSLREDVDAVIQRLGNVGALTLERM
jgi:hypothetical protein